MTRCMWKKRIRRMLVAAMVAASAAVGLPASATAAGPATEAIRTTINEVTRLLEDRELKKPGRSEERRRLLEKVIGGRFSYEEMAKRSLGIQWRKLNDAEKKEFVDVFQRLLSNTYAEKIERYSGEEVQYLAERLTGDYAEVRTKIVSDKTAIPVDYRLLHTGGEWQVYDVVVDGVSLVRNYREQFTRILRSSSYADLLDQLRRKVGTGHRIDQSTHGAGQHDEARSLPLHVDRPHRLGSIVWS